MRYRSDSIAISLVVGPLSTVFFFPSYLGNENQPEVSLHIYLLTPPRVMDVRAFGSSAPSGPARPLEKTLFSCALSDGVNVFGPGRPPGYPPGRPQDIPPQKLYVYAAFRSWPEAEGDLTASLAISTAHVNRMPKSCASWRGSSEIQNGYCIMWSGCMELSCFNVGQRLELRRDLQCTALI